MEQQQQQQGNAQQAEQLAELQKQIVNATWKLIRRETASTPTEPFAGREADPSRRKLSSKRQRP